MLLNIKENIRIIERGLEYLREASSRIVFSEQEAEQMIAIYARNLAVLEKLKQSRKHEETELKELERQVRTIDNQHKAMLKTAQDAMRKKSKRTNFVVRVKGSFGSNSR